MFQSIITSYPDMRDVRVLIDGAPVSPSRVGALQMA